MTTPRTARQSTPSTRFAGGAARALTLAALMSALLVTAGCGGGIYEDPVGDAFAFNDDSVSTVDFAMKPTNSFGDYGPNLLAGPLPPGGEDYMGTYFEDFYDAYAEQSDGFVLEFHGEWVPAFGDVTFVIAP